MNKIKIIIGTLLIGGLFPACEGFLGFSPASEYTDATFYLTPTDFRLANNAIYQQMTNIYGNSKYMNVIISRGDEVRNFDNISRYMDAPTEGKWQTAWTDLWAVVYRCNKVISRIDAVEFTDAKEKEHLKGEALATRGWCYLQFAWCWGGAPLITREMSLSETYKEPRANQAATYAQAEADLALAYELLPEKWTGADLGRVTRYAAAGVLGRTYLYQKKYNEAAIYLAYVVEKEGSLYGLENNYDDCFNDAFNNTKERVWEVQYMGGSAGSALKLSQSFCTYFIPSSLNVRYDGPVMNGVTFAGLANSMNASQSLSGKTTDLENIPCAYENGDKRKDLTIVSGLYLGGNVPTDYYFCKKFLKATKNKPTAVDEWGNNLPILRFTDVKLMYAEALNEINYAGNQTLIFKQLNDVRRRAGLADLTATELPDKTSVFNQLVQERNVEFCFEGLRWPDLVRWGKAQEMISKHFRLSDEGYNTTSQQPTYAISNKHLLAPIPYQEVVSYRNGGNNENIQNPGW